MAEKLLDFIQREDFTAQGFREQIYKLYKSLQDSEEPEPPTEEVNWTILPPDTLEDFEFGEPSDGGESVRRFVDMERLQWLARFAMSWGEGSYIAVANLDKEGNYDYRVAILPQGKGSTIIEHAVAENPASKNAVYAFRAERGVNDDGSVWLTWRDVLSDTKSGARALGARRIKHNANVRDNVLEYLTRPEEELDRAGYRR